MSFCPNIHNYFHMNCSVNFQVQKDFPEEYSDILHAITYGKEGNHGCGCPSKEGDRDF